MRNVLAGLLVLWLILALIGVAVKGLIWLAAEASILFLATAVIGVVRWRAARRVGR